jgi:hypothetical protein
MEAGKDGNAQERPLSGGAFLFPETSYIMLPAHEEFTNQGLMRM